VSVAQLQVLQKSAAFVQFISSLHSKATKIKYTESLLDLLKYANQTCDQILKIPPKQLQALLIQYIIDMRDNRKLAPNSIRQRVSALQTFFQISDVEGINWKKVKRFIGEFFKVAEDRPYSRVEIKHIIDAAHSIRDKAIILLLSSSGLRIGGLTKLQLKHLKKVDKYNIFQIEVYKKAKEQYVTFCSPETREALEEYLNWRARLGEKLTLESPLFRQEFETKFGARAPTKPITHDVIINMIRKLRFQTGIVPEQHLTENVMRGFHRTSVMTVHGFRKYFATTLETEGVNPVYVELLLGHDLGLKGVYSKPTPKQLLEGNGNIVLGYSAGMDALTINEDNRLRKKVQDLDQKTKDKDFIINSKLQEEHGQVQQLTAKVANLQSMLEKMIGNLTTTTDQKLRNSLAKQLCNAGIFGPENK
jgi:integrase